MSRRPKNDEGAVMVEMALLLATVLLPIVFGIVDFGLAFMKDITITNVAHEGARVLAVGGTDTDARSQMSKYISLPASAISTTACTPGGDATVIITYKYDFMLLKVLPFFNKSVTMHGKAVEKCA